MPKIEFQNKTDWKISPRPRPNKVVADDLNEIKASVNWLYDNFPEAGEGGTSGVLSVKQFGALGDGTSDDTEAIQNTLDIANGRWVYFPTGDYRITESINCPEGTRIIGYSAKVFNAETPIYLINVSSNTVIRGLELEGSGAETADFLGRGINFLGTVEDYKENLLLEDLYIHDIGFYGVYAQFSKNIIVNNSKVFRVGYGGIFGLSVENMNVLGCHVKDIDFPEAGYGISFTRETIVDTLEVNPRSKNCKAQMCLVENVLQWKAYDTHGGENISFVDNISLNCRQGIGIVGGGRFAPKNCQVIGNNIQSDLGQTSGSTDAYAIVVAGIVADEDLSTSEDFAENILISNNISVGCGRESSMNSGAFRFRNTRNLVVSGNLIQRPLVIGMLIQHTNYNFSVFGNTVEDPNTSDENESIITIGIQVQSRYNHGVITGNVLRLNDSSLNFKVGQRGLNVATSDDNRLIIKNNENTFSLNDNIPLAFNIQTDHVFNNFLRINRQSSGNNLQMIFNEGYLLYADNAGGQNSEDPVAFWLAGRAGTTVYVAPRSGQFKWVGVNAETLDVAGGRLRVAGSTATLEPSGPTVNADGSSESGNAFKNGIHYTTISAGLDNNYPENSGLSFVIKSENSRILHIFSNTSGDLWYRSLTTGQSNVWHRVRSATGKSQTVATSGVINNLTIQPTTDHLILTNATELTGIISGQEGRELIIENRNSVSLEIPANSGSSDNSNRSAFTFELPSGEMIKTKYTNNRWRRVH